MKIKNKKNKTHITLPAALLGIILTTGVMVAGSHVKDVMAHAFDASHPATLATNESKKVSSELHNHIEKQTLKSMVKVSGDDVARTDRRHLKVKHSTKHKLPAHVSTLLAWVFLAAFAF